MNSEPNKGFSISSDDTCRPPEKLFDAAWYASRDTNVAFSIAGGGYLDELHHYVMEGRPKD